METRTAPLIGGRYRIEGALGEGGMARVFAAYDERLQRPVAVKVLRAETRALPGMRRRFQQEALIAARLTHPHIVAVLDFGEDDSTSYLVMERLPGQTLRDEIVERGPLPEGRVALVMAEMLTALASAHGRGVLHRDIKPSNILLQQDGHTKITDFGIAKSVDARTEPTDPDDLTMTGVVLGTPGYLAPERRSGHPATVRSDLYGAGAVMVEALTGRRLAPGPVPTETLPPRWRAVASRALVADPRLRFPSATDMLEALHASGPRPDRAPHPHEPARAESATVRVAGASTAPFASATAHLPPPPRPPGPQPRPRRERRRVTLAAASVTLLAAGLTVLAVEWAQPTGPASTAAFQHHHAGPRTQAVTRHNAATSTTSTTDPLSGAISALAATLAEEGLPGDGALAERAAIDRRLARRSGPAVRGAAGALPRRRAARRRGHHARAIPRRGQCPAAGGRHHHHHDRPDPGGSAACASGRRARPSRPRGGWRRSGIGHPIRPPRTQQDGRYAASPRQKRD